MSGYMKVLAEYSDKAGHKDRTGHIKRITGIITAIIMLITTAVIVPVFCCAEEVSGPDIDTPSAILMEAATGQVIYEKDADTVLAPASITKIMTLILIFEAIEDGSINMEDPVTVSEYAASMGGSQVFLEPGEIQSVRTMIKCIAVASANDACVAMAEHIIG